MDEDKVNLSMSSGGKILSRITFKKVWFRLYQNQHFVLAVGKRVSVVIFF